MILIITHKEDYTADFVINKLNQQNIAYKRLNCEDIFNSDYSVEINSKFNYSILGESNYHSVWFRRTKLPSIDGLSKAEKMYILHETECFFKNLFATLSAKWLSSPISVYTAENKLLQLKKAKEIGFKIPPTLITNSKDQLKEFFTQNKENIILKPISQTRIQYQDDVAFVFTSPISSEIIEKLGDFDLTPCIYQENIAKDYEIRVTVVGDTIFSAAVFSQQDRETIHDWRKKKLKFHSIELPNDIKEKCFLLVKSLNLEFGAIDLIKTPEGEYFFLEINPNGQWAWIEIETGLEISNSIIEFLTS